MTARERVHELVEVIPESDLATVERMLSGLAEPGQPVGKPLTPEERRARVQAARGSLRGTGISVDAFLREKHEETEREEARLERHLQQRNQRRAA